MGSAVSVVGLRVFCCACGWTDDGSALAKPTLKRWQQTTQQTHAKTKKPKNQKARSTCSCTPTARARSRRSGRRATRATSATRPTSSCAPSRPRFVVLVEIVCVCVSPRALLTARRGEKATATSPQRMFLQQHLLVTRRRCTRSTRSCRTRSSATAEEEAAAAVPVLNDAKKRRLFFLRVGAGAGVLFFVSGTQAAAAHKCGALCRIKRLSFKTHSSHPATEHFASNTKRVCMPCWVTHPDPANAHCVH